eukprot:TRINITY_DN48115_c0_g1_i1.p1 TRINITY_DN48115_c0_g1~~TRINITY_DN48115_c0_g1_i1.p1  ORF type:complete len:132 (-),score=34.93 TRINITY_DN48115_c0_g1_i1:39-434(-)
MGYGSGKGKGKDPMMMMMMAMFMKGMKGNDKGKGKGNYGLKTFDGSLRVWIGGLPEKGWDVNKRLKDHLSSTGLTCQYAAVGKDGSGGAAFKTKEEAEQAVATFNGSTFEGNVITVDRLKKGGVYWNPEQS